MIRMLTLLTLVALMSWGSACEAAGPDPIRLWPDGAPGAQGDEPKDVPEIRIYPAPEATANGACVVVLPGGGYGGLAMDHEGHQIATWLNSIGVSAAVVSYRLGPKYHHPAPLQDAQRGIRYVRAHAAELKIDPHRVGIMGFSAGGHLASTVSTHFDAGDKESSDPVAQQSSRPDFSILCYPVISMKEKFTHQGSKNNLLGKDPDPALVENLSNETQVTKETPPTFIFQTDKDTAVPAENCVAYYLALRNQGVPAELHIYQNGPHGVGLAPKDPVLNTWKDRLADWLKVNGFLSNAKRAAISGTISVAGTPLRWGTITFTPQENENAPSASAMVSHGKFSLGSDTGPVQGPNAVTICSLGDVVPRPTIEDVIVYPSDELVVIHEEGNVLNRELK
ncbi:alpha/beta hydrolase [Planctomicrobium sp. SH661]|uniref:alpha/beta hydrolase n=1 Tax=Planctomicrobium sp. SH661 TaxID=3448124 RepID=UPI003F5C3C9A